MRRPSRVAGLNDVASSPTEVMIGRCRRLARHTSTATLPASSLQRLCPAQASQRLNDVMGYLLLRAFARPVSLQSLRSTNHNTQDKLKREAGWTSRTSY